MMKLAGPLCVLLLWSAPACVAQTPAAVVYVYALKHIKTMGRVAPPVYVDDKQVAKLDGERYFILRLAPGSHSLHLKDKKRGGVELEFKAGETYYVRLNMREGATVGPAGLTLVARENATFELKQMKPIKPGDIKDARVSAGAVEP